MKKILFYASAVAVMLSSCSKDTTEISVPESGNLGVFSASIELDGGPSTRLHLDKNEAGNWIYVWDGGDGVGVSSVAALEANIPAYTLQETTNPRFSVSENDTRYFGGWNDEGTALYAYYPYNPEGGVLCTDNDGNIVANLKINPVQRYEFESFYKNTVSAVGYVEKYVLGESHFNMKVPFSILRFKVRGFGETKALTLKIQKPNSAEYYDLAGNAQVVIPTDAKEMPSFMLTEGNSNNSQQIVLTFGSEAEGFEYDGNDFVTFVVPAGLDLYNATVELYNGVLTDSNQDDLDVETLLIDFVSSSLKDDKYLTKPGAYIAFKSYPFNFGMDGKFVIEDDAEAGDKWNDGYTAEEKFLVYAYLAQHQDAQNNVYPKVTDWKVIADKLGYEIDFEGNFASDPNWVALSTTIAWIKSDANGGELDFSGYKKPWAIEQKTALNTVLVQGGQNANPSAEQQMWLNIYDWIIANDGAIESLSYNAIEADKQVTIKHLKVKGKGLVAKSDNAISVYGNGAKLTNLTFTECEVVSTAEAGFIAPSASFIDNLTNVIIGADNTVTSSSSSSYVGGLFSTMNVPYLNINADKLNVEELPDVVTSSPNKGQIAGLLSNNTGNTHVYLADYKVVGGAVPAFAEVRGSGSYTFNVPADVVLTGSAYAGVIAKAATISDATPSIIVGDTAYWNGTVATLNDDVAPLTAEELAYILASKDNRTIELALNYDMQDNVLSLSNYGQNPDPMVISGAKTISNLKVETNNKSYYASLFGKTATLTDVTLKDIVVNVVAPETGKYYAVAGLAQSGTVKNVTVDGLILNIANGTAVKDNIIGGIFSKANTDVLNGGLTVKNTTINNIDGFTSGVVAAVFDVTDNNQVLKNLNVTTSRVVKSINQMVKAKRNEAFEYLPTVTAYNKVNIPFGAINVSIAKWENDLTHTFTVESSCSYGERFASRVWFPVNFLGPDATSVKLVETDSIVKSDYVFNTNANAGANAYMNQIGFQKKL